MKTYNCLYCSFPFELIGSRVECAGCGLKMESDDMEEILATLHLEKMVTDAEIELQRYWYKWKSSRDYMLRKKGLVILGPRRG